ncbi:MAG: hypothetical protein BGN83_06260 [Rhizobium sp. 63-7]|nr:MAG: hypothetical protein BGN83_06260 [Rhizobium sp. 63-7]
MREFPPSRLLRRYADGSDMLIQQVGRGSLALFQHDFFFPFETGHVSRPDPQADRRKNSVGTFSLSDSGRGGF